MATTRRAGLPRAGLRTVENGGVGFGRACVWALAAACGACSAGGGGDDMGGRKSGSTGSSSSSSSSSSGGIDLSGSSSGGGGIQPGTSCGDGILRGVIRDFHNTFPDMEPAHSGKSDNADDLGIVQPMLGADLKPLYAGPATGTVTTTGPENFDKWYRDDPVNLPLDLDLQFEDPDGDGVFSYDNQAFFPIDGQGFGNEPPDPSHNYHFTFELHTLFEYEGRGEEFKFVGDDDVFVFINGKLEVNLGGVHGPREGSIALDTLGLTPGESYQLDFFFAERHVTASHFRIDTTIKFVDCGITVE